MKVSILEKLWYVIWCIATLGVVYLFKCVIKIAIAECENSRTKQ